MDLLEALSAKVEAATNAAMAMSMAGFFFAIAAVIWPVTWWGSVISGGIGGALIMLWLGSWFAYLSAAQRVEDLLAEQEASEDAYAVRSAQLAPLGRREPPPDTDHHKAGF